MPTVPINQLPPIPAVTLDDLVVIEQLTGTVYTTHKGTVRQLIGSLSPVPTITTLTWNAGITLLQIEGENLLPTTLVFVNDIPYKFDTFQYGSAPNPSNIATVELGLSSLTSGTHTVKVKNLIHEDTDTFTF